MRPVVINLRERFGDEYQVRYEEAYQAEYGKHGRTEDPWLMVIPCKFGELFPFGSDRLAAFTNRRGIGKRLISLPCCQVHQESDYVRGLGKELIVTFDVARFQEVAQVMKPKKRRRGPPMTEERKRAFAELGRENLARFHARTATTQSPKPAQV